MEDQKKLPLKRIEFSLIKFNEVAIPHHLDLLRQHRANIIKYEQTGELPRVRSEQTHARRVAAQLRSLLRELELLRVQVQDCDLVAFDKLTQKARDHTLKAIMDYLESSPMTMSGSYHSTDIEPAPPVSCSAMSTESVGLVAHQQNEDTNQESNTPTQLQLEKESSSLAEREAVLRGWDELQAEVRALRDVWEHVQQAASTQGGHVGHVQERVLETEGNVDVARGNLAAAERLRAMWYPVAGLVIGGAMGGPLGLVLGIKAGAAAALAGSFLGYTGVTLVRRNRREPEPLTHTQKDK